MEGIDACHINFSRVAFLSCLTRSSLQISVCEISHHRRKISSKKDGVILIRKEVKTKRTRLVYENDCCNFKDFDLYLPGGIENRNDGNQPLQICFWNRRSNGTTYIYRRFRWLFYSGSILPYRPNNYFCPILPQYSHSWRLPYFYFGIDVPHIVTTCHLICMLSACRYIIPLIPVTTCQRY